MKRIEDEESDNEDEEEEKDDREAIANELFEGDDMVSFVNAANFYNIFRCELSFRKHFNLLIPLRLYFYVLLLFEIIVMLHIV